MPINGLNNFNKTEAVVNDSLKVAMERALCAAVGGLNMYRVVPAGADGKPLTAAQTEAFHEQGNMADLASSYFMIRALKEHVRDVAYDGSGGYLPYSRDVGKSGDAKSIANIEASKQWKINALNKLSDAEQEVKKLIDAFKEAHEVTETQFDHAIRYAETTPESHFKYLFKATPDVYGNSPMDKGKKPLNDFMTDMGETTPYKADPKNVIKNPHRDPSKVRQKVAFEEKTQVNEYQSYRHREMTGSHSKDGAYWAKDGSHETHLDTKTGTVRDKNMGKNTTPYTYNPAMVGAKIMRDHSSQTHQVNAQNEYNVLAADNPRDYKGEYVTQEKRTFASRKEGNDISAQEARDRAEKMSQEVGTSEKGIKGFFNKLFHRT